MCWGLCWGNSRKDSVAEVYRPTDPFHQTAERRSLQLVWGLTKADDQTIQLNNISVQWPPQEHIQSHNIDHLFDRLVDIKYGGGRRMFTNRSILFIRFYECLPTFHILLPHHPPFLWDHLGELHAVAAGKGAAVLVEETLLGIDQLPLFSRLVCKVHHTTFYEALFLWSNITCIFSCDQTSHVSFLW